MYFNQDTKGWTRPANASLSLDSLADNAGYIVSSPNGTRTTYSALGLPVSKEMSYGRTLTYSYKDDQLTQISDQSGRKISIEHNGRGFISSITVGGGLQWVYDYDELNRLIQVTNPDNTAVQYAYDDDRHPYALTRVIDERGIELESNTYDSQGRIGDSHSGLGNQRGLETKRTEGHGSDSVRVISTIWKDDIEQPSLQVKPKSIERFEYDSDGRLLRRTEMPSD